MRSATELAKMRAACRMATQVLREAAKSAEPGMTTSQLDAVIGRKISFLGGVSAFLGYRGFPGFSCLSVNEEVIHGIGSKRRLEFGDLLKIDIGVRYLGYIGDTAKTVSVGGCSLLAQKMMNATVDALYKGISAARGGESVQSVGRAVSKRVHADGFGVVREFCGHGVGKSLHEDPQIPNYPDPKDRSRFKVGMTVAIEPMVTMGGAAVEVLEDGWTVVTRDRKLSAHFEHTILITDSEPEILTRDEDEPLY